MTTTYVALLHTPVRRLLKVVKKKITNEEHKAPTFLFSAVQQNNVPLLPMKANPLLPVKDTLLYSC